MEKIYSKLEPHKLLHIVHRVHEFHTIEYDHRKDIVSEDEFLQLSSMKLGKGHTFKPHQHGWKDGEDKVIAQESWVVVNGSVECSLTLTSKNSALLNFDLKQNFIAEKVKLLMDSYFEFENYVDVAMGDGVSTEEDRFLKSVPNSNSSMEDIESWEQELKTKAENGMENLGFPMICTEKDGKRYLKKRLRKKS